MSHALAHAFGPAEPAAHPPAFGAEADAVALSAELMADLSAAKRRLHRGDGRVLDQVLALARLAEERLVEAQTRIRQLENLTMTDELTGLSNRRGFQQALARSIEEARRHGEFGVVALIDLDGFKQINDRYGHEAGDRVLIDVGHFLKSRVRSTDYVARLGGDEFAIIYTRTDVLPTRRRILKLKEGLRTLEIPYRAARLRVGASVGLEPFGPGAVAEEVVHAADLAMYADKARR
jgi:diguanylate cyclase (GGDEF)-like protein